MPLETKRISIDETAYTIVGAGVTVFDAGEYKVGTIRAVVVPAGGDAPLAGHTDYREWNDDFRYADDAADIYMMSPLGQTFVGVIRK